MPEKIARECEYRLKGKTISTRSALSSIRTAERSISVPDAGDAPLSCGGPVPYRILIWGTLCFHVLFDHEDYFRTEFEPKMKATHGISPQDRKGMQIPPYLREFK